MQQPHARRPIDSDSHPYEPPSLEVISLDCEISSYAPDESDTPLF